MRIVTWNINSVRIRLDAISQFVKTYEPDILCLQETKVRDEYFPVQPIIELGFKYYVICGEKSYNGVAIFSKHPLQLHQSLYFCGKQDARHLSVIVNDDIELHNFYIPAGGDIPDVNLNTKFAHKLNFVDEANNWFLTNRRRNDKIILLGDLNIAPLEHDVWSHKQLLNVVSHTPIEVEKLVSLQNSINFIDVVRKFVPDSEKLYSWWSYRNQDWKKSNRGRRLDHIWMTEPLANFVKKQMIFKEVRDYPMPSDHVPVMIEV
jgi:exodeoxyribonuclease-3